MNYLFSVILVTLTIANISCSKKQPNNGLLNSAPPPVPSSIPTNPDGVTIDQTMERTLISNVSVQNSFESGLQGLGIYTPDICFQFVNIKKRGSSTNGYFLEISSDPCPGAGLLSQASVLLTLNVKQHPTYFTQFHIREESRDITVGIFRYLTVNSVSKYVMEGLCQVDTQDWDRDLHYTQNCLINVEGSLFGKPALFID